MGQVSIAGFFWINLPGHDFNYLPQFDPAPAVGEGLAWLREDLAQEGGGEGFDRLKPGLGRRAGLLNRRHLLAQHPRNPSLLGKGWEGDAELFKIISAYCLKRAPSALANQLAFEMPKGRKDKLEICIASTSNRGKPSTYTALHIGNICRPHRCPDGNQNIPWQSNLVRLNAPNTWNRVQQPKVCFALKER
jgi:hypothetical protein